MGWAITILSSLMCRRAQILFQHFINGVKTYNLRADEEVTYYLIVRFAANAIHFYISYAATKAAHFICHSI